MAQLLEGKNAIIYGAGGGIGGGVARTFAREGATVFLVGRTKATLQQVADDITPAAGRPAWPWSTPWTSRQPTSTQKSVVDEAGSIDVSFNLITRGDAQGTPLTTRAAAQRMIEQR
jgi:NAD(P)-dependent dehydrogenase (short-subunit alcohol dehydrogenase family)